MQSQWSRKTHSKEAQDMTEDRQSAF